MHFDTIKSSTVNSICGCFGEPLGVFLDFGNGKGPRRFRTFCEMNGGRSDEVESIFKNGLGIRSPPKRPELEVYRGSFSMYGIRNLVIDVNLPS